jgi:hypothetical protein
MSPHAPVSPASRRRLARRLVGSSLRDVERDLVLETLSHTHGRRRRACLGYRCGHCGTRSSNIQQRVSAFLAMRATTRSWRNPPFCCFGGVIGNRCDDVIGRTERGKRHKNHTIGITSDLQACCFERQSCFPHPARRKTHRHAPLFANLPRLPRPHRLPVPTQHR